MTQQIAPLLLHVGYHKTGSTWLQKVFFCNAARGFAQIGRPRHNIAQDFVRPDVFDFSPAYTRELYAGCQDAASAKGLTLVVSHERLSGYPGSGGYDRKQISERLAEVFPGAKVLIVIREQISLICSMYSQYITDGGGLTYKEFFNWPEPGLGRMPYFRYSFYEFDRLIDQYQTLFGKDNVLVLPLELMSRDHEQFLASISRFCGHDPQPVGQMELANEKRPYVMQQCQRIANRLLSRNELGADMLINLPSLPKRFARLRPLFETLVPAALDSRLHSRLKEKVSAAAGARYYESNRRTCLLTGLRLDLYGYACSPEAGLASESANRCA